MDNAPNWRKRQRWMPAKCRMLIDMTTLNVAEKNALGFLVNEPTYRPIYKMAMNVDIK